MTAALDVKALCVEFHGHKALDNVSASVARGESFGLVGESGSGKSTLLRAVAGLAPVSAGTISIDGRELRRGKRDRAFYREVQMVFQDPYGSLHPRQTIDRALLEPLAIHGFDNSENRIVRALEEVGLGKGFRFRYPHQLSGGQRQRVAIARALIVEPSIVLLDEPTSALDASVQAEILNLLEQTRKDRKLTFVMVSHDLAVVSHMCERLAIMQGGHVVETLPASALADHKFEAAYTKKLFEASEGFSRTERQAATA
ncbi:ABC transporter ATP-binding protein [Mycoplana ramosa]|uniref:Glutathione import ATP-binding protein GsiA n=1 Tax=Mycoplana ramosa TaxID=40837 RepID=A0ABW3YXV6_MYCRA